MIGTTSDKQNPLVDDGFSSSMPKKGEQSSAYQNTKKNSHTINDENEVRQCDLRRHRKQTAKGIWCRRDIFEEKSGKPHSHLLQTSSAIDALSCSFQNMNTVREELHLLNDQFKMIFEVHEEYHQLLEDHVTKIIR